MQINNTSLIKSASASALFCILSVGLSMPVQSAQNSPKLRIEVPRDSAALSSAIQSQDEQTKARYSARNPKQTLNFFGIMPGMTVVEVLPGSGWYSKILLPYLGENGKLIGVDYPQALWPNFSWMTPERIEDKKSWPATWTAQAEKWRTNSSANVEAFKFAEMPEAMKGTADAVLYIRALHNLARFDAEQGFLGDALSDTMDVLKPGGIVGIVQHQARENQDDQWADGSSGYLKKSTVITRMQDAGFEFVGESNINENPKDLATKGDIVWRLPPSYNGSGDDETKKARMTAIGESNRMTLMFRKPN